MIILNKKQWKELKRRNDFVKFTFADVGDDDGDIVTSAENHATTTSVNPTATRREEAGLGWMSLAPKPAVTSQKAPEANDKRQSSHTSPVEDENAKRARPEYNVPPAEDPWNIKNPRFPKHLIIALGDYTYLRIPAATKSACHVATLVTLEPCPSQREADAHEAQELDKFKQALRRMAQDRRQGVVFYEVATDLARPGKRAVTEVWFVDSALAAGSLPSAVRRSMEERGERGGRGRGEEGGEEEDGAETDAGVNASCIDALGRGVRVVPPGVPYVSVEIEGRSRGSGEVKRHHFVHPMGARDRVPPRFLADALRSCSLVEESDEEEEENGDGGGGKQQMDRDALARSKVKEFGSAFKPYDWTVELDDA